MSQEYYQIESSKPFSESLFWQLNRDFYQQNGIDAWSDLGVPHHLTSNSVVGKTYAELIFAFLKDLASHGNTSECVYILELGAGQGRLAYHILKHLDKIVSSNNITIPPYCYVLSDIGEENITFFQNHPQFQKYINSGQLDIAYFDGLQSEEIQLRHSQLQINPQQLDQPIIAIANYFFDSIPTDLFLIRDKTVMEYEVALHSYVNPKDQNPASIIKDLQLTYHKKPTSFPFYNDSAINQILEDYKKTVFDTHLFFPHKGLQCLKNLQRFSNQGLMLLSLDKGYHKIHDIDQKGLPELVRHGSFSLWVNYHAYISYCESQGGKALFPSSSNFHLELGCFLFLSDSESYSNTSIAYEHFVNDFGPDDFTSIKKLAYSNVANLSMQELLALIRMSHYDSTFFLKLLPRIKQVSKSITVEERNRLVECLSHVWNMYFHINEPYDLPYELGGLFYDMGLYNKAIYQFQNSIDLIGSKADSYHNQILCYYQLRNDIEFYKTLKIAKTTFPNDPVFDSLDKLDMIS
ncbi:MAG: tetratricopeptide (TPR) repeat protein [Saprospiraceae bacterium]|jgi:tetratricopeptide (TPR) repeat protein